jgi:histidinol phosphatase-like PHP family hydrolase
LGSDSHPVVDLEFMAFSAGAVMLAGVSPDCIINCVEADDLVAWTHQHRRAPPR